MSTDRDREAFDAWIQNEVVTNRKGNSVPPSEYTDVAWKAAQWGIARAAQRTPPLDQFKLTDAQKDVIRAFAGHPIVDAWSDGYDSADSRLDVGYNVR